MLKAYQSRPHHVFVNDDIYLDVFDTVHVEQAISASIELIFILLGKSDLDLWQDPISWDKLEEMIVATCNKVLGLILNTCNMTISIPDDFIASLNTLLKTTWGPHRKSFSAQEAAELAGKLGHASIGAPQLKLMVAHVYTSLASALWFNKSFLINSNKFFLHALAELNSKELSTGDGTKHTLYQSKVARFI